ncbi:MAG: UDP-N-acetylmuramoyl-L-alanyl-D-glutamate--2,6-diaminopimelate ligase [Saprospiraceae bacterium]|nr:UDP-N-acetylmuramoyl-L-alanyl-D-glutamate--2,6-diaminopimelate ligase [Saprospiraceae bacterium]MBK9631034.1 UDP-N-acetylmuramoyl-L-alanyl-D-glutamate--2,6-diaminopimelate ligase [Saprospiraceae bacterium]
MKDLSQILPNKTTFFLSGNVEKKVTGFSLDSRNVEPGEIFVAKKGTQLDGHKYIPQVIEKGIKVILCEYMPDDLQSDICYIQSNELMNLLADMLRVYYEDPSQNLTLIGVTGTNGKTTVSTLCYELLISLGYKTGLISTVENKYGNVVESSTHTTPDIVSLYRLLNKMVEAGCSHVCMEVSSHAIDQDRILGLQFKVAVFTNITQDHLDYHGTFKNYIDAKKKFFDNLSKDSIAIVNADDKNGLIMVQNSKSTIKTYGVKNIADYKLKILNNAMDGLHLKFQNTEWHSNLAGTFNASNLAAVLSIALELGEEEQEVLEKMSGLHNVSGRFDLIRDDANGRVGIVDYAHTPDAVEKLLLNVSAISKQDQKIITVLGCGGNRDKSKRPMMASVAVRLSDQLILTSDNPRDEDPLQIIEEMESGIDPNDSQKVLVIQDREQAIKTACSIAQKQDIIIVAGKGHEKYQEIKGVKMPFDDYQILKTFLLKLYKKIE